MHMQSIVEKQSQ